MKSDITYEIHSMMVSAVVDMEPTKLEMVDGFKKSVSGHIYSPPKKNVRTVITGSDWSQKKFLIYGCESIDEGEEYVTHILEKIRSIGHRAEQIGDAEAANIAVNGNLNQRFRIENLKQSLSREGIDAEYEPEQFPGLIIHLDDPSVTFILFSTGKFVIQGVTSVDQIEPSISNTKELINRVQEDT